MNFNSRKTLQVSISVLKFLSFSVNGIKPGFYQRRIRRNHPPRSVVAAIACYLSRLFSIHSLFDVGGLSGRTYLGPYLSPMYSPLSGSRRTAAVRAFVARHMAFVDPGISFCRSRSAFLYRVVPAGSVHLLLPRLYKAPADPPACTVGEPRHEYRGEKKFPLILQNVHRYFLYAALIFIVILAYDAIAATQFRDGFAIGVGNDCVVAQRDPARRLYLGCHSLRHLVGGRCDTFSTRPVQHGLWRWVSKLNKRHMLSRG